MIEIDARPFVFRFDVARTALRVVLFPVRIVVDYGVRWPIGKLVTAAEHSRGVRGVISALFLGPPAPAPRVYPIAFYDFGFQSSIGVRAETFHDSTRKGNAAARPPAPAARNRISASNAQYDRAIRRSP